jgi:hypothetical protein
VLGSEYLRLPDRLTAVVDALKRAAVVILSRILQEYPFFGEVLSTYMIYDTMSVNRFKAYQ